MTDRSLFHPLNLSLLAGLALTTGAGYLMVPPHAEMPIHWGLNGEADGFAPAFLALSMPLLLAALALGIALIARRGPLRAQFEAGRHVMHAVTSLLIALALLIQLASVALAVGYAVDMPRLIVGALGFIHLVLGNYLPKTRPNTLAGARLPWLLDNPQAWLKAHRLAGWGMMLGGAAMLLAAWLAPSAPTLFVITIVSALTPVVLTTILSYIWSRRHATSDNRS